MSDIRIITGSTTPTRVGSDGQYLSLQGTRDGAAFTQDWVMAKALEGRVFVANSGEGTTPATHAGAYDADAPDLFLHVPSSVIVIPVFVGVKYEAFGTELIAEVIGLVSSTGDSSATGTALTIKPLRLDAPVASACTATGAVDAAGITDPHAGTYLEFLRRGNTLVDTVATGENDRMEHLYDWKFGEAGLAPIVNGGGSVSIYATGQAPTGFITLMWVELPASALS